MSITRNYRVMKRYMGMALLVLLANSCAREHIVSIGEGGDRVKVAFSAGMEGPSTRAYHNPSEYNDGVAADRAISRLRVLVYRNTTGALMESDGTPWNFVYDFPPLTMPAQALIRTGTYDFVFITNELSDATFAAALATPTNVDNIAKLSTLTIGRTAYDAITPKNIPMVRVIRNVQIKGENTISY